MPCLDPVLIMSPGRPRAIMPGAKAREPWITPQRLTPRMRCQFSAGPNIWLPGWMPALFIRISVPPNRFRTASSRAETSSTRLTSVDDTMTLAAPSGAAADSFASASARRSVPRSAIQTFMPRRAKRAAAARPMPDAPPVTTATWLGDMAGGGTAFSSNTGRASSPGSLLRTRRTGYIAGSTGIFWGGHELSLVVFTAAGRSVPARTSRRDGAADANAGGTAKPRAAAVECGILRPARHAGRPDHRRSLAGDGDRTRQSRYARRLFGA